MSEIDELFDLKNSYYLGNFSHTVNEANKLKLTGEKALERDVYLYRAMIGQKQFSVLNAEIKSSAAPQLLAVKAFATFLSSGNAAESLKLLDSQLQAVAPENWVSPVMCAAIHLHEKNFEGALRTLQLTDHLESMAMQVQIYCQMERPELARKTLKQMQDKDEDATLTQLAQAWTNLVVGGEKLQESYYIFQELMDKNQPSPTLLNGAAASHVAQGKWEEADGTSKEAAEKDPNFADTLINQVVVATQMGNQDVARRTLASLRGSCANHPFVQDIEAKEAEIDRLIKQYQPVA